MGRLTRPIGNAVGLLLLGAMGLSQDTLAQEVGAVAGEFSVSRDGQATYTVPIQVPPGIRGVEPGIAVGYHSGAGNGVVGLGGQLTGFSTITRCAANFAEDGMAAGVRHRDTDRFCLDGQKLLAVSGGYGLDGSQYRTVVESFQKVVSHGQVAYPGGGSGPSSFTVHLGNGGTLQFGLTDNARVRHPGTQVVHEWRVSRMSDVHGNAIDYLYQDFASGSTVELQPVRIDYGGNTQAGQDHHLAIRLAYEDRPDSVVGYRSGLRLQQAKRLSSITTEADGADVRHYFLGYDNDTVSGQSRLARIDECAADGSTCYAPTTFNWRQPQAGWSSDTALPPDDLVDGEGRLRGIATDLNGDGRIDWLTAYRDGGGEHRAAWLATGSGFTAAGAYQPPSVLVDYTASTDGVVLSELVDVNGDRLPDWVTGYRDAAGTLVREISLNDGTGFRVSAPYDLPIELTDLTAGSNGLRKAQLVDINGDARVDVVASTRDPSGTVQQGAWLNTGNGWTSSAAFTPPVLAIDYASSARGLVLAELADLNDDGLADWVQAVETADGNHHHGIWLNTGRNWTSTPGYTLPLVLVSHLGDAEGIPQAELVDINGDGLLDVVQAHRRPNGSEARTAWLNTGDDWVHETTLAPPVILTERTSTGLDASYGAFLDLNGDSRPDIARSFLDQGGNFTSQAWRQTATGWVQDNSLSLPLALHALRSGEDSIPLGGLVDMNHDGVVDLVRSVDGYTPVTRLNGVGSSGFADVQAIDEIVTGFGMQTRIEYATTTHSTVYTAPGNAYDTYPDLPITAPQVLVEAVEASDGVGGTHRAEHTYGDGWINLVGHGALGFGWHDVFDPATTTSIRVEYAQAYPHVGQLLRNTKRIGGNLVSQTVQTLASKSLHGGLTEYPYVTNKVTTAYELDGTEISAISVSTSVDDFGNVTQSSTQTADVTGTYSETVTQSWQNDTANWLLGKATGSVIENTAPNVPSMTRTTQRSVNARGQVTTRVVEPGHADALTTSYAYDSFGNITSTTTSASGLPSRTGTLTYTSDGRFPATATNALGHTIRQVFDARFGEQVRSEDPNGVVTTRLYDSLGRQIQEKRLHLDDAGQVNDGTDVVVFQWCGTGGNCPSNARYFVGAVDNESESPESVYYDPMGREVRRQTHGFDGRSVYQDTEYNARGQKQRVSRPYFSDETPEWTTYAYDPLDRVILVTHPNHAITSTSHAGRSRTVTNPLGQTRSTTVNAMGKPVTESDAAGNVTHHVYDALGRLIETRDPVGNLITASFDQFGRKIAMSDPDMGAWTYQYDAFGQLLSQTDARGQTVTMDYDLLGRMVQRVEPEGTTTWTYDTAPGGIGKLATVSQPGYQRDHAYDDRGRLSRETVSIDGQAFVTEYAYEGTTERVDYVVYPNGWTIQKSWNDFGYPLEVRSVKATDAAAVSAQEQVYLDLHQAAVDLEADLADDRQDHYNQMVHRQGLADPLAAQAKSLANEANRKVEQYNDAARKSRQHAQSYRDHVAAARELERQIQWRADVQQNHINKQQQAANEGNQAAYDFHTQWAQRYYDEAEALDLQRMQKIHVAEGQAHAADQWAQAANGYATEAENLQNQAEHDIQQANAHYATANTHADAIHAIDRQVQEAVDAANDAHSRLQALQERLNDSAITHWAAQGAGADGQITRFSQGNGIVTDLTYYNQTGRVARIQAMGNPELGLPLTAEDIQTYLDRLDGLVADYNARILDFQVLATTASHEKAIAEADADGERAKAQGHRDLGESALALLADARAVQLDVEVAIGQTRITLNTGLMGIHADTVSGALALISQYQGAAGVPGQDRALEAGYHDLLTDHYNAIANLYASLSSTYAGLEHQADTLEASPPTDEAGFLALAAHSTELASFNALRASVHDQAMMTAAGGGVASTPLSQQNLSLAASLLEQRGHLFEHHGDVVDGIYRSGRELATILATYYDSNGLSATAGHYQSRTNLGEDRVTFLRRMAQVYKDRGTTVLGELQAEQAAAQATQGGVHAQMENPFADLAALYTAQSASYTEMSTLTYWQGFYLGLGNRLADATGFYAEQAAGNASLADQHAAEATLARNANDHRLLVGIDGAVQDEQYFYDVLGNLTARVDHAVDLQESFGYDNLNRLTDSNLAGEGAELYAFAGIDATTYGYDAIGNLTHRSDVGNYTYAQGAGAHAVTAISGLINTAFAYDANGNQLSGHGRTITWSSYNKPLSVSANGDTIEFAYGPNRELIKKVQPDDEGGTRTTYYVGPLFEKTVSSGGSSQSRYHITAAGNTVAVINESPFAAAQTHYLHRDNLDSIVATSNERGQVIERFHYDAFGKRRIAVVDTTPLALMIDLALSDRGFTGHRHLESVNLIHMNGRVYDPTIGRFLSADPHIQFPGFSQSYNRYSYLLNNPLNATDPSGYFLSKLFKPTRKLFKKSVKLVRKVVKKVINFVKENIRTIIAIAVVIVAPYAVAALATAGGALVTAAGALTATGTVVAGALGGGLAGLITTGSLKGALIGAATGAALAGIGNHFGSMAAKQANTIKPQTLKLMKNGLTHAQFAAKTAAHGVVGGLSGKLSGGSFSKSFVSMGFTQLAAPGIDNIGGAGIAGSSMRILAGGVVGGTASVLAGGQFNDGFKNGVLSRGLNHELPHGGFAQRRVIDSTAEAVDHYYNGHGEPVELGPKTQSALRNHPEQIRRSNNIRSGSLSTGNYGVEMRGEIYHVGSTTVQYDTLCGVSSCRTTFTGFTKNNAGGGYGPDGFWDITPRSNDTIGPAGELGGTPYPYTPHTWTEDWP